VDYPNLFSIMLPAKKSEGKGSEWVGEYPEENENRSMDFNGNISNIAFFG